MKDGMHAPAPARGGEVPEVPQVPPAPRGTPPAPGLPGIAIPQPRPATGRIVLPDDLPADLDELLAWLPGRDDWTARTVASLLWHARLAGQAQAALTASQVETLLAALGDAFVYRRGGAHSRLLGLPEPGAGPLSFARAEPGPGPGLQRTRITARREDLTARHSARGAGRGAVYYLKLTNWRARSSSLPLTREITA